MGRSESPGPSHCVPVLGSEELCLCSRVQVGRSRSLDPNRWVAGSRSVRLGVGQVSGVQFESVGLHRRSWGRMWWSLGDLVQVVGSELDYAYINSRTSKGLLGLSR